MISILLPVYNAAATLPAALESIRSQDFEEWELVLADDGSVDESEKILNAFSAKEKRAKVIRIPHSGIVTALTTGLQQCSGKYIARMDADDVMHPQRLSKQFHFLENNPGTGLVSCLVTHGGNQKQEGYRVHVDWLNRLRSHEEIALSRFVESPLAHPSVMFRKSLVEKYGGYREGNFPEDYELWLRWLEKGVRMEKIPEVLLNWNDSTSRLSRTDERYSAENFYRVKEEYLPRFIRKNSNGRKILAWGAGKLAVKRSHFLFDGFNPGGYIDVDPKKTGKEKNGIPVFHYENIPLQEECYIVSFVSNRGKNEEVRKFLLERNFREGTDFVLAG